MSKSSITHFRARLKTEAARKAFLENDGKRETFRDFYGRISPHYVYPEHLQDLVDAFERIDNGESVELVVTVPPRHSKTETIMHGIAWLLQRNPRREFIYGSYSSDPANEKSRIVRQYCEQAGIAFADDANQVSRWKTKQGGGFLAGGVGGGQTGFGGDVIIIDDPYKGLIDASSGAYRKRVREWVSGTLYTRRSPGASFIIVQTRWHPDDIAGEKERGGWQLLKKPAINEEGKPLWGERFSLEELAKIKSQVGSYVWNSLYECEPPTKTGALFPSVYTADVVPPGCIVYCGIDMAYSEKTSADYSVAVFIAKHGHGDSATFYVIDVIRSQSKVTAFAPRVIEAMKRHGVMNAHWYASGTELGGAGHLRSLGLNVVAKPPRGDKKIRALHSSALWEEGRVRVIASAPWADEFAAEVCSFTGVGDDHDDIVDAMVAALDAADGSTTGSITTSGEAFETRGLGVTSGARKLKW